MKNKGSNVLVSTVIPSYKQHAFLKKAIFSVLQQTHKNQEILIINDFPSEEARSELKEISLLDDRIKLINNSQNVGIATTRNVGINHSNGKYVAFLDHDDMRYHPEKLARQVANLENDQNIALVGTSYVVVDGEGNKMFTIDKPESDFEVRQTINFGMPTLQSSIVVPKLALDKIGGYDPHYSMTDDYEIIFRLGKIGLLNNLKECMTHYRIHETNTTKFNINHMRRSSLQALLKHGRYYPHYFKGIAYKFTVQSPFVQQVYQNIRPHLSDKGIAAIRYYRDLLKNTLSQSYNHTGLKDQDEKQFSEYPLK